MERLTAAFYAEHSLAYPPQEPLSARVFSEWEVYSLEHLHPLEVRYHMGEKIGGFRVSASLGLSVGSFLEQLPPK